MFGPLNEERDRERDLEGRRRRNLKAVGMRNWK